MVRLGRRVRKSSSPHNLPPTRRFRSNVSRRGFLGGSAVNLGFALAGAGSLSPFVRSAAADTRPALCYRPLQYTEGKILALPHSFDYKVIAEVGQVAGGMVHPDDPDAMGVFPGSDGGSVLVTNHENSGGDEFKVEHVDPRLTCDTGSRAIGGTTTILVGADNNAPPVRLGRGDGRQLRRRRVPVGHLADLRGNHQQEERHRPPGGPRLRLEVDPTSQAADVNRSNGALKFLGRYAHEAVAIDPSDWTVYGTEDAGNPNGLFDRWTALQGFPGGKGALIHPAQTEGGDTAGTLEVTTCFQGCTFVGELSQATQPGTREKGAAGRGGRARRADDRHPQAVHRDRATRARARGRVVGRQRRLLRLQLRPGDDGSATEHDGQMLRPEVADRHPEDHLRRQRHSGHRGQQRRRPGQHHRPER